MATSNEFETALQQPESGADAHHTKKMGGLLLERAGIAGLTLGSGFAMLSIYPDAVPILVVAGAASLLTGNHITANSAESNQ